MTKSPDAAAGKKRANIPRTVVFLSVFALVVLPLSVALGTYYLQPLRVEKPNG